MPVRERHTVTRGSNKGDTIIRQAATKHDMDRGNWYPVRVVRDVNGPSTLRDNSGVEFSTKSKRNKRTRSMRSRRS